MEIDAKNHSKSDLVPGIYEKLVDQSTEDALASGSTSLFDQSPLSSAPVDASEAITLYIRDAVLRALRGRPVDEQLEIANRILRALAVNAEAASAAEHLQNDILLSVHGGTFGMDSRALRTRPSTPLSKNAVFTATDEDPQLYYELNREIPTADLIYLVVSFIKWSGLDLVFKALQQFTARGGELRVLSTAYMHATEATAIERLASLPNTLVRMSLDTSYTRLHAKAYVFCRKSGFSTAYIGSSNMSRPALTSGFEWNTKIAAADSPDVFQKILVTCEEYWNDPQFIAYEPSMRLELAHILSAKLPVEGANAPANLPFGHCVPFPFQLEVLDRLEAERLLHGRWRNLIVAATGTGKTMMAAFDYARLRRTHPKNPCRLLFVAHREEILSQSIETFRRVLGEQDFGELHVGDHRAEKNEHLFISIQSVNATDLCRHLPKDHFDYIVIDEFHHAAAPSYRALLDHFSPRILLGLTATPERADGRSILDFFDGRIAAEIRLPAAIDQDLLCPFHYFGLPDTVDLDTVKWRRGGYDVQELSDLYSLDGFVARKRADHVLENLRSHTAGLDGVKALGFCVSVAHAEFMARHFSKRGIHCAAVSGSTPRAKRKQAIRDLAEGRLSIIFCVDLFNEGVDIPEVNAVLFLRPTESLTVFLQQLGRGLRLCEGKDYLLVLDFIGMANRNYRFDEKFGALLRDGHRSVRKEVENGFRSVPRGCSIELAEKPMEIVLDTISRGFSTKAMLRKQLEEYIDEHGRAPSFAEFLHYTRLAPQDVYKTCLYSRLLMDAGAIPRQEIPMESQLRGGLRRFAGTNAPRLMQFLLDTLPGLAVKSPTDLDEEGQRMIAMFYLTLWDTNISGVGEKEVRERLANIADSDILMREISGLLRVLIDENMRLCWAVKTDFACPLEVHGTYTRNQIYASLGNFRPRGQQAGVLRVPGQNAEALFVTLEKDERHFADSINYKDYAIDASLFHWQSQNSTSPDSPSGQNYIHQRENGSTILLFLRRQKEDVYGAQPYFFAGPVQYKSSSGSRPMNILWELEYPLDPVFLQASSRLVV